MIADRMTEEEREPEYTTDGDVSGWELYQQHLVRIVDPAEMGKRWTPEQLRECLWAAKRAGTVTTDVPPGAQSYTAQEMQRRWRIVPDEEGAADEGASGEQTNG